MGETIDLTGDCLCFRRQIPEGGHVQESADHSETEQDDECHRIAEPFCHRDGHGRKHPANRIP